MWAKIFEAATKKKDTIFILLFIGTLYWLVTGYDKREDSYIKREDNYHQVIADNTKVMQENSKLLQELQKTNEGFKNIIEVKLAEIERILDRQGR